jgi:glucokinase
MSPRPAASPPWLLADVGGTKLRFALARPETGAPLLLDSVRAYRVAEFPSFADAARAYLATVAARPANAVLAFAGRIDGDRVQMTNLPWTVAAPQLQADLGLHSVHLVNDFAAVGMSLPLLGGGDVLALGPSVAPIAPVAGRRQTFCVLGPGTGLGVSALAVEDGTVVALQTEGGHTSFAPTNEEEIAVLRQLLARFGRVSVERLLCGSGLANLHQALAAIAAGDRGATAPLAPEEITARAQRRDDTLCVHAVERFCELLGTVAGDFALTYGAWDGVYLAGGLLAPLMPWLQRGRFRERFNDKGRFAQAAAAIPVAFITHPQPGLLGAAGLAVSAAGYPLLRAPVSAAARATAS